MFSLVLSSSTIIDEVLEELLFPSPPVSIMVGDSVDITIIGIGFGVGEKVVVAVVTELDMVVGDVVLLFVSAVDGISVFIITIVGFVVGRFVVVVVSEGISADDDDDDGIREETIVGFVVVAIIVGSAVGV